MRRVPKRLPCFLPHLTLAAPSAVAWRWLTRAAAIGSVGASGARFTSRTWSVTRRLQPRSPQSSRPKIVVHCRFSQDRGPRAAALIANACAATPSPLGVLVLEGGWRGWSASPYGNDGSLTTKLPCIGVEAVFTPEGNALGCAGSVVLTQLSDAAGKDEQVGLTANLRGLVPGATYSLGLRPCAAAPDDSTENFVAAVQPRIVVAGVSPPVFTAGGDGTARLDDVRLWLQPQRLAVWNLRGDTMCEKTLLVVAQADPAPSDQATGDDGSERSATAEFKLCEV